MSSSTACVDASFVVRLFLGPDDDVCWDLLENWLADGGVLHAPGLLRYELANVIYRHQRAGHLSPATAELVLDAALGLPIRVEEDPPLHRAALRIAQSCGTAAAYDAHYVALAKRLGAELWTADRRLAGHAASCGVMVNVVGRPQQT